MKTVEVIYQSVHATWILHNASLFRRPIKQRLVAPNRHETTVACRMMLHYAIWPRPTYKRSIGFGGI